MRLLKSRRTTLTIVRRLKRSVKRKIRNSLKTLDTALASQDSIQTPEDLETSQNTRTTTPQPPHPLSRPRKPPFNPSHPLHPLNQERLLSQYSPNPPTTPTTQSHPEALVSSHAEAISTPLPGDHSKMIFYDIPVSASTWSAQDYERRFKYVKGELMRAVVDNDELRLCGRHINYSLHMIGSSAETAVPSILIECRKCDLKSLRDLFNPRVTDRLYCRKESAWHKLFNSDIIPPKPPFQLIYLATNQHPMRRYAAKDTITVLKRPIQTLCGALVEHEGRMATVSLTLMVDGIGRLVTVGHLFSDDLEDEASLCTIDDKSSQMVEDAENGSHIQESARQIVTGEAQDYHHMDGEQPATMVDDPSNHFFFSASNTRTAAENEYWKPEEVIKCKMVEPLVPLQDSAPYLDWTLVDTDTQPSELQIRNFIFPDNTSDPVLLQRIADVPRFHGVPVYMISGREGPRNGRLLGGLGYLGPRPGHEPCPVWTLLLDSPKGLTPGECGSIVVDQETFEVYGHVVGANIMKHIYVVPLKETVEQVRLSFNAATVCLPQLRSPSVTFVTLNHQIAHKGYSPSGAASPQLWDDWYKIASPKKIVSATENKSYIAMLQEAGIDIRLKEVETFMQTWPSNRRSERRKAYVEGFCKGGQFALDSSVPQSVHGTTLPNIPYKARVSDWDPRQASGPITSAGIRSNLELYEVLSKKRLDQNAQGHLKGALGRRIYINSPNGTSILALIRTTPASQVHALSCLLQQYIMAMPKSSINIGQDGSWGSGGFQLSFQFSFWALFPRGYEDLRPPDNYGRPFRRQTDLSALIHDTCFLYSDDLHDQHYLHEAVISVTITGRSEEYWTVFCFEDGPSASLQEEMEDEKLGLTDEMLMDESSLHATSPRSYFLHAMATSLEKASDYQQDVLDLLQYILYNKVTVIDSPSLRQGTSSIMSFERDMMKILEEQIGSVSRINTTIQRFLSQDAVIGYDQIPQGPYLRSLRDDAHAMKLFYRIMKCCRCLEDTESQLRRLFEIVDDMARERRNMREPLLLERLLQNWKTVSFVSMVIIQFACVAVLAWVASTLRS